MIFFSSSIYLPWILHSAQLYNFPLCKYTTFHYPFICWWISRLFHFWLLLIEQQWTWLSKCLCSRTQSPLYIYPRLLYLNLEVDLFLTPEKMPHQWLSQRLYKFALPLAMEECSTCGHSVWTEPFVENSVLSQVWFLEPFFFKNQLSSGVWSHV